MHPTPAILLSIDYEPWFALTRRYDTLYHPDQRRKLDGEFTLRAIDPILEMLSPAKTTIYLVGEIAEWYPEIPQKIVAAGHELGMHCQYHRPLIDAHELELDLAASNKWRSQYNVLGYRAPMVGISEAAYPMLETAGFAYSSSIYAPSGHLLPKGNIHELPVSTLPLFGHPKNFVAPRDFSVKLLTGGEVPFGSSFMIGLMPDAILKILEREIRAGLSPVIILHPYELIRPDSFLRRIGRDVASHPLLFPFTLNKSNFLKNLLKHFPVSPLYPYIQAATAS